MDLARRCIFGEEPTLALSLKEVLTNSEAPLCLLPIKQLNLHERYWNTKPWCAPIGSLRIHESNNSRKVFRIGYFETILRPIPC